jgi:ABC-2 type transport system permease protein
VALGLSGLSVPLACLPEAGQTLAQISPMFPVVDLVHLSLGTVRVSGDVVTGAAFWSAAVMDLALVGWVAVGLMVIRRAFRWEPRQ